jgi:thiol-disulfide isomerase/thioredoxin
VVEVVVLAGVLLAASVFGVWRLRTDGRVRSSGGGADTLTQDDLGQPLGERATLVQFSSAFCAPCRTTRSVLGRVADAVPGVTHVEVDAESHLDLVRRLDITRTPTTLVLDGRGREIRRATGVPRNDEVLGVLSEAIA